MADNINEINPLSMDGIMNDRKRWRENSGYNSEEFEMYSSPIIWYFKLVFFFENNSEEGDIACNFLHPSWLNENIQSNSAYNFLKLNGELERMDMLKEFITTLSDISSSSPWIFQEITGLQEALKMEDKIPEERKKIEIKCLPDGLDARVSMLLDMYKSIVYSKILRKEIVPANLRKFDLGLYIFPTPVARYHDGKNNSFEKITHKYIEFHNCEFDINSGASGITDLNNSSEPKEIANTISILFDSVREKRFSEVTGFEVSDYIWEDLNYVENPNAQKEELDREVQKNSMLLIRDAIKNPTIEDLVPDVDINKKIYRLLGPACYGNLNRFKFHNPLDGDIRDIISNGIDAVQKAESLLFSTGLKKKKLPGTKDYPYFKNIKKSDTLGKAIRRNV